MVFLSCASTPQPIQLSTRSEQFTVASMAEGGVIVGGVVSYASDVECDPCGEFAAWLDKAFQKHRPELKPGSPEEVSRRMGQRAYEKMLNALRNQYDTPFEILEHISIEKLQYRYLLFGSIDDIEVTQSHKKETTTEPVKDSTESGGQAFEEKTQIHRTTKVIISTSLYVYDLENGILVWEGTIEDSDSKTVSYGGVKDEDLFRKPAAWFGNTLFDTVYGPLLQPGAPAIPPMIKEMFASFAAQLP